MRPILRFVTRKVLGVFSALSILTVVAFVLVQLIPGDTARVAAGAAASVEQVEAMRQRLGLDSGMLTQFLRYVGRLLHGDLGTSIATHTSVSRDILSVLPDTIGLVVFSSFLMVIVVVPAAYAAATRMNRPFDQWTRAIVVFVAGLPAFWLALVLQYVFGSKLAILPISGVWSRGVRVEEKTGFPILDALLSGDINAFVDVIMHLLLPATILALSFGAYLFRALRAELLQVLGREFLSVARAKGVDGMRLASHHVIPNAAGPALTILGIQFGNMVGGAILVEIVFGLPGIGTYLTNAITQKDIFAIIGGVLVIGVIVVLTNLLVDLLQLIRDPRLREGEFG